MTFFAAISLTAPLLLYGGALGVSLPVIAHLLNRRARRKIVFPTIRLLAASSASQSSLFKIRRWLLLALRSLAVLLVAAAFAQPVWTAHGEPSGLTEKGAAVVLVIDASASSAQRSGGVRAIDTIAVQAQRTLDALSVGEDLANVVYAGVRPRAALPQLTRNVDAIRHDLASLRPTFERANLPDAIALAADQLASHHGPRRLVIVSDMQATNWRGLALTGPGRPPLPQGTRVTVLPVEADAPRNVALSDPRCEPARPVVNRPAQLVVSVTNFGAQATLARVTATLDGGTVGSSELKLEPWETRDVGFNVRLDGRGGHQVEFTAPQDGFDADNTARLSVMAVSRVPVLLVADDDADLPGSASFYLARALAPRGDASDELAVKVVPSRELTPAALADAEAVFISEVATLTAPAVTSLIDYLTSGGGAAMFCGGTSPPDNLETLREAHPGPIVPWRPVALRDLSSAGAAMRIDTGAWSAPLLSDFDERSREALRAVLFRRVWSLADSADDAQTLLTFTDGTPALSAQKVGAGTLVVANFSPASNASNLGRHGSFVALVQSLARQFRPKQDSRSATTVGEPLNYPVRLDGGASDDARGRTFTVMGPDDQEQQVEVLSEPSRVVVRVPRPALPGFYRIQRDGQVIAAAALNLDPRESDLRPVSSASLQPTDVDGVAVEVKGQGELSPVLRVHGRPLWPWFVAAAMVALGVEMLLLSIWRR